MILKKDFSHHCLQILSCKWIRDNILQIQGECILTVVKMNNVSTLKTLIARV